MDTKNGISLYRIPRLNLRRDSIFLQYILSLRFYIVVQSVVSSVSPTSILWRLRQLSEAEVIKLI